MQHRRGASQVGKNDGTRVCREHESWMIGCELLESPHCFAELELTRKIKCRIEERAVGGNRAFGNGDSVQRSSGVDAEPDSKIDGVAPHQPPPREVQRFLEGVAGFARAANQKNPKSLDAMRLYALGDVADLRGVEPFLEAMQHRIAGAFRGDAERAETSVLHGAEEF